MTRASLNLFAAALLGSAATLASAETPQQMVASYSAQAAAALPGFAPSAERGQQLFLRRFSVAEKMPACTACHTDNPAAAGKHAITSKPIQPLAPAANPERLTSAAKVEKWFRRNCTEVIGRECSAAEKADFLQFLAQRGST